MELELLKPNWQIVEENTKESFRVCKNDIINFGVQLAKVQQAQRQLAEEVGEARASVSNVKNGKVDFSGVYNRIEKLDNELHSLRESNLEHIALEKEMQGLKARYNDLVDVTKKLMVLIKEQKAPQQTKIVRIAAPKQKVKIIKIATKRLFLASTATMRVHDEHCPFAANIKRKNKKVFKTRLTAFKKGYRACKCLK